MSCARGARVAASPPLRRPPPPAAPGLILREITDDDANLPAAIILRELPPEPPIALHELPPEGGGLVLRELPPDAPVHGIILGEVIAPAHIEGFEATLLDPSVVRPRAPAPPPPPRRPEPALQAFRAESCPSCGAGQNDPYAAFCESCSARLPRVRRAAAAPSAHDSVKCRLCGLANSPQRSTCTNCGHRLGA